MKLKAAPGSVLRDKNVVPTAALVIGAAVAFGVLARVIVGVITSSSDTGTRVAGGVLGSLIGVPLGSVFAVFCAVQIRLQVRQLGALAAGHPKSAKRAWWALGSFAALLAVCGLVAAGARGTGLGATAWLSTRLLISVLIGGGTVFLACWPYAVNPAARRRWPYLILAGWTTVGAFLLSTSDSSLGVGLLLVFGLVLAAFFKRNAELFRRDRTVYIGGQLAVIYLTATGLLWLDLTTNPGSASTVARYAGEAAIAAVLGSVIAPMIWRRTRESRPFVRRFSTAATALVLAYLVFLVLDDQLLGGPLVAPLFPVMIWLGIRLWRTMGASRRVAVKAGADVMFALVIGSVLVLSLIWLANLLAMPPAEAQLVKDVASHLHGAIDLSPWIWFGIYAVLAAAQLLSALGPEKYQAVSRRLAALRVVPSVNVIHRTMTTGAIALLVVALLGLAVPPTTGPILRERLQATYTVAAQEELKDDEQIAVYQAISTQLGQSRPQLTNLANLVIDVHRASGGRSAEDDLAHRLGLLQGNLIALGQPRAVPTAPSNPPDLTAPLRDAEDLEHRVDEQQDIDTLKKARDKQVETAADLAANTVSSLLDLISIGHAEALSIVHEYINALAESPLGEIFLDWTKRALARVQPDKPPAAAEVVEPDPHSLAGMVTFAPVPQDPAAAMVTAVDAEQQAIKAEQLGPTCPGCGPGLEEPEHDEPLPEIHGR
ncbi:MAG TPA: hypothetical protein VJ914_26130 [Pseudonocardiaceae bacterium]|nr:hypothetical protein [Pseudonocardiaceae bacterium]